MKNFNQNTEAKNALKTPVSEGGLNDSDDYLKISSFESFENVDIRKIIDESNTRFTTGLRMENGKLVSVGLILNNENKMKKDKDSIHSPERLMVFIEDFFSSLVGRKIIVKDKNNPYYKKMGVIQSYDVSGAIPILTIQKGKQVFSIPSKDIDFV